MTSSTKTKNDALIALRKAVAKGGSVYCHAETIHDRSSYSDEMTFNFSIERKGLTTKGFTLPGICRNGHDDKTQEMESAIDGDKYMKYVGVYRPLRGFFSLNGYNDLVGCLEAIPDDAEVKVEVYLDAGTNEICVRAGLHCDHVYLKAKWTRGKRLIERCFLLKSSTGLHNSARFGGGR